MRVHIAQQMPNGTIHDQIFDGVEAHINAHNVLQIYYLYSKRLLAEFPPDTYVSWQYVALPFQPTSRAGLLLHHHEK
jgi:hypothetical protein